MFVTSQARLQEGGFDFGGLAGDHGNQLAAVRRRKARLDRRGRRRLAPPCATSTRTHQLRRGYVECLIRGMRLHPRWSLNCYCVGAALHTHRFRAVCKRMACSCTRAPSPRLARLGGGANTWSRPLGTRSENSTVSYSS